MKVPEFMTKTTSLKGLEIIQGSFFISKPNYIREEQILCAVDGRMSVVLVPHINRQEVYAGEDLSVGSPYDDG